MAKTTATATATTTTTTTPAKAAPAATGLNPTVMAYQAALAALRTAGAGNLVCRWYKGNVVFAGSPTPAGSSVHSHTTSLAANGGRPSKGWLLGRQNQAKLLPVHPANPKQVGSAAHAHYALAAPVLAAKGGCTVHAYANWAPTVPVAQLPTNTAGKPAKVPYLAEMQWHLLAGFWYLAPVKGTPAHKVAQLFAAAHPQASKGVASK